jgi:putative oxidoreductase
MLAASPWVLLLSRVLMAAIFIQGGYNKAMAPGATMAMLAKYSLPMPGVAYAVTLLVEIGAGIAFLIGWKARSAALVLAIWCVATALVAHYHPEDRGQMIHFMKNLALMGTMLFVIANGPGAWSVDNRK